MEPFLGEIRLFGGTFAPRGWADCDGRELRIDQNQSLYSILGNNFGGDQKTVFNLPKMDPPVPKTRYIICLQGMYPSRN